MSSWMRVAVLAGCCVGTGCEAAEPEASAERAQAPAQPEAKVAAADAPIAPGERAPKRAAEDDSQGPDPAATSDLDAALSRLAQRYAGGWVAASAAFEAELEAGSKADYQMVLGSAHCYRVLGVGSESLEDVDLRLFDPLGVQVQQDEGTDRFPVVGLSYPVCPPSPGAYRLQAIAVKGSGTLKVQAFHGP